MPRHQYRYQHIIIKLSIVTKIMLLFTHTGIAQPSAENEYISGFRILKMEEVKKLNDDNRSNSNYYYKRDSLFKAKDYEKVIRAMEYASKSVTFNNVGIFYQSYTSCLHLKRYTEALAIAEKGLSMQDNLGWRKTAKKRNYDYGENNEDTYIKQSILEAGKYKALMGLKRYDEALDYCKQADLTHSFYISNDDNIDDLRDFFIPIRIDLARIYMHKGQYEAAIKALDNIDITAIEKRFYKSYWEKNGEELYTMVYTAICEINYLNNTPGNIPGKAKKGAIRDFKDYGDLITLYNASNYQGFITAFKKIDDGNFTILYKYLGLSYYKLGQKEESCNAFSKYRSSHDYRQPKVEPEVDEAEAVVCK
jgi:tetratricopeptide (TPR) repeat protein